MASVLKVSIYSEISEFPTEKRYDPSITIAELKKKLELITGANHTTVKITLFIDDKEIGLLDKPDETLAYYVGEQVGKDSTLKLVVKDEQPTDLFDGDVPKYEISEDKYLERENNARNFIKQTREKQTSGQ